MTSYERSLDGGSDGRRTVVLATVRTVVLATVRTVVLTTVRTVVRNLVGRVRLNIEIRRLKPKGRFVRRPFGSSSLSSGWSWT